jgi:hypothetical protein
MKMDVDGLFRNTSDKKFMDKIVKDLKTALVAEQGEFLDDDDESLGCN